MFGIRFDGPPAPAPHPHAADWWQGHPLRKEHPARATEMGPFELPDEKQDAEQEALQFRPEDWGLQRGTATDATTCSSTSARSTPAPTACCASCCSSTARRSSTPCRDIGYHHRGAEKMGERQTWHTYIPYTDRIDYLGGVMNNLPYVLAVEKLAGHRGARPGARSSAS